MLRMRNRPPSERPGLGPRARTVECGGVVLVKAASSSLASARRGLSERSRQGGRTSDASGGFPVRVEVVKSHLVAQEGPAQ